MGSNSHETNAFHSLVLVREDAGEKVEVVAIGS